MTITSDEVNYLIYRYLQESGFSHSSFALSNECHLFTSPFMSQLRGDVHSMVPSGYLVSLLQKALLYLEVEAHVDSNGMEKPCSQPFSLIYPHSCKEKISSLHPKRKDSNGSVAGKGGLTTGKSAAGNNSSSATANGIDSAHLEPSFPITTVLHGHKAEVFSCKWNPTRPILLSGSRDASARLWNISNQTFSTKESESIVLEHKSMSEEENSEKPIVTSMDWSRDGSKLVTGTYDGITRVWNYQGELLQSMNNHKGPVFAVKWNPTGNLIASGSADKTSVVWDSSNGEIKQVFGFHSQPILDLDWKDDNSFASCSTDRTISICEMNELEPVRTFQGHQDEVNTVKWDSQGILLASCSDDKTAKIWSMKQDSSLQTLSEHTNGIYTLCWSPASSDGAFQSGGVNLATASFDSLIKLWDVEHGRCVMSLAKHTEAVCSIAFSPDGQHLASGSFDRYIRIWNVKDGTLLRSYLSDGGVYEVSWNSTGDKLAGCTTNHSVCIIDVRF